MGSCRLLVLKATWMADNKSPTLKKKLQLLSQSWTCVNEITLKCVGLAASVGYGEDELLENGHVTQKIL